MITLEHWALIRQLHLAEGVPKGQIARQPGLSRNAMARALASPELPSYRQPPRPLVFDEFEPRVRALLAEFSTMPATVIAERVGWAGSPSWFRKRVALLRPENARKDPADRRISAQSATSITLPRVPKGPRSRRHQRVNIHAAATDGLIWPERGSRPGTGLG